MEEYGFSQPLSFQLPLKASTYSSVNGKGQENSGGNAAVMVNPVHMACLCAALYNGGNIVKPNLILGEKPEFIKEHAFTEAAAEQIRRELERTDSGCAVGMIKGKSENPIVIVMMAEDMAAVDKERSAAQKVQAAMDFYYEFRK